VSNFHSIFQFFYLKLKKKSHQIVKFKLQPRNGANGHIDHVRLPPVDGLGSVGGTLRVVEQQQRRRVESVVGSSATSGA
jgi:hypothetical protein